MKILIILFYSSILLITLNCSTQEQINNYNKIEPEKFEFKVPKCNSFAELPSKYNGITIGPYYPEFNIQVNKPELLINNDKISPAKIIGDEVGIESKIVYSELAKRAEIEGSVIIEFEVDKKGSTQNILLIKDIGGLCGENCIQAIKESKFVPARLNTIPILTKYRIKIGFKIVTFTEINK